MGASALRAGSDIYISPKFKVSDWKNLRMGTALQPDWQRAVAIFHDRLDGRFLAPVKAIREHDEYEINEYGGFVIVAIDCLLIETLGQFYHGFDETPQKNDSVQNPEKLTHREFYMRYIEEIGTLSSHFDSLDKRCLFYTHFRCGILHQAQTKKGSRVRYGEAKLVDFANQADAKDGLIVDRNKLHDALLTEIASYESLLKSGADSRKQANFITKMDFIA